jgi:hypothetical protein
MDTAQAKFVDRNRHKCIWIVGCQWNVQTSEIKADWTFQFTKANPELISFVRDAKRCPKSDLGNKVSVKEQDPDAGFAKLGKK